MVWSPTGPFAMSWALFVARCLLAVVFTVAGLAKLAAPRALRETLLEFGLPSRAAAVGAFALPLAELAVAVLLLPTVTARWAALGAFVLLGGFCVAIGRALARGERPECGCLGSVHSEPIGPGTLVRDVVLAAVAVFVAAAGPGRSAGDVFGGVHVSALAIVFGGIVALQGWFLRQLFGQNGRLLARVRALEGDATQRALEGLAIGSEAPALELPDHRALDEVLAGGLPVALVFSSPGCESCTQLLPELRRLRAERDGELEILLIEENREALENYRMFTVPSATLVGPDGRIASPTAIGSTAVTELLEGAHVRLDALLRLAEG
jgi:uncharacterized membrane protein YphA (DoxX/SURF4 family)